MSLTELLIAISLWCGTPNGSTEPFYPNQHIQNCRDQILECLNVKDDYFINAKKVRACFFKTKI